MMPNALWRIGWTICWRNMQTVNFQFASMLLAVVLAAGVAAHAQASPEPEPNHKDSIVSVSDAKADCEAVMNSVLPFAKQMLTHHGEFIPFGGAMRPTGELVSVAGYGGQEHPKSTDVIRLIKDGFVDGAKKGDFKATALVYDVRITLPNTGEKSDAIAVSLNHQQGYSVVVLFPYKLDHGRLTIGAALAQKGEADIFFVP
jgi:hypothetical protein